MTSTFREQTFTNVQYSPIRSDREALIASSSSHRMHFIGRRFSTLLVCSLTLNVVAFLFWCADVNVGRLAVNYADTVPSSSRSHRQNGEPIFQPTSDGDNVIVLKPTVDGQPSIALTSEPTVDDFDLSPVSDTAAVADVETLIGQRYDCQARRDYRADIVQRGEYWVMTNYLQAEHGRLRCFETLTYTTHSDYTFLDNLQPLLERWQAPISIAMYAPGSDIANTLDTIRYVRDCGSNSHLVRQYATFHLYFPAKHMPPAPIPTAPELLRTLYDCDQLPAHQREQPETNDTVSYRIANKLLYPVNVGRNIARNAAMTHFVLASDIELYPNPGLPQQFLGMIARSDDGGDDINDGEPATAAPPRIWPLVLFEVNETAIVPTDKTMLQQQLRSGEAITFHKHVCANCHGVPHMDEWMEAKETKTLAVSYVGKRVGAQRHWEPIYIGTHADPPYDERLSWEGMSDKMPQAYALCVLNYEFRILNNAFLVHRPGIKFYAPDAKRLAMQAKTNAMIRKVIRKELILLYGEREGCAV